jgi:hypothetical protein
VGFISEWVCAGAEEGGSEEEGVRGREKEKGEGRAKPKSEGFHLEESSESSSLFLSVRTSPAFFFIAPCLPLLDRTSVADPPSTLLHPLRPPFLFLLSEAATTPLRHADPPPLFDGSERERTSANGRANRAEWKVIRKKERGAKARGTPKSRIPLFRLTSHAAHPCRCCFDHPSHSKATPSTLLVPSDRLPSSPRRSRAVITPMFGGPFLVGNSVGRCRTRVKMISG